jgi:hypothetical protein
MYEGHIVKELVAGEADAETLGLYMTGGGGSKLGTEDDSVQTPENGAEVVQ